MSNEWCDRCSIFVLIYMYLGIHSPWDCCTLPWIDGVRAPLGRQRAFNAGQMNPSLIGAPQLPKGKDVLLPGEIEVSKRICSTIRTVGSVIAQDSPL